MKDHICLSSPDVPKMTAELKAKPQITEFPDAIADIHQLDNGKNVVEIYDLDHNRVETMEPLKAGEKDCAAKARNRVRGKRRAVAEGRIDGPSASPMQTASAWR